MRLMLLGVIGSVVLGSRIAAAEPAWCKANGVGKYELLHENVAAALDPDVKDALAGIVAMSCWPDAEAKRRTKEIEAARATWSKKLDLTEADWTDVAVWASAPRSSRGMRDFGFGSDKKIAWASIAPLEQYAGIMHGFGGRVNYTYLADALGAKLSETGRLAFILKACVRAIDATVAEWAVCAPDLALLDRKKLADELRRDTSFGSLEKMIVRLQLFGLDDQIKQMTPEWQKARGKDPVYDKMFAIAQATRKEWDKLWQSDKAVLDLMLAMDDVRETSSRKLREGCEDKVWPALKSAVSKVEAKRFEGLPLDVASSWLPPAMGAVAGSPQGWLALAAYHTCKRGVDDRDLLSSVIGRVLQYLPGYRGPRTAAYSAIMNAGLQLDDASATIKYPQFDYRDMFSGSQGHHYFATVAKVTVKGDQATVTFKPKLDKQNQCVSSKPTKRISHILDSGTIMYESQCLKWGSVSIDRTPDPQVVHKRYIDGLKPGMNVVIASPVVMAAWPKGKNVPSFVLGAPVK